MRNVVIFDNGHFSGNSQELGEGSYNINSLQIGNDRLSSLRIPQGLQVTLYEHAGFQGRSRVLFEDTPSLDDGFNDLTSSIRVERRRSTVGVSNANWMADMAAQIGPLPLRNLVFPGTHDSATSNITSGSEPSRDTSEALQFFLRNDFTDTAPRIAAPWSKAQGRNITQQLEAGIRFLDIRVCYNPSDGQFWTCHGFYSDRLDEVFASVRSFVNNHPREVILLLVSPAYLESDQQHQTLISAIVSAFGSSRLVPSRMGLDTTLNELWNTSHRIVTIYRHRAGDVVPEFWSQNRISIPPFVVENYTGGDGGYQNPDQMKRYMDEVWSQETPSPERLRSVPAALTPDGNLISRSVFGNRPASLLDFARDLNPRLMGWLWNEFRDQPMNVIGVDWFEESTVVDLAKCLSDRSFYTALLNRFTLVYEESSRSGRLRFLQFDGFNWSLADPQIPNVYTTGAPGLAIYNNRLFCLHQGFAENGQLWWTTFDGLSWGIDRQVPEAGISGSPAVAEFNNRLYCVYEQAGETGDLLYAAFDGTRWLTVNTRVANARTSGAPGLAVFRDKLYCFHQGSRENGQLWYTVFNGATWTPDQQLAGAGLSRSPAVVVFRDRLYCVYEQAGETGVLRYSVFNGTNWEVIDRTVPNVLTTGTPSLVVWNDILYCFHQGREGNRQLWYTRFDGVSWAADQRVNGFELTGSPVCAVA